MRKNPAIYAQECVGLGYALRRLSTEYNKVSFIIVVADRGVFEPGRSLAGEQIREIDPLERGNWGGDDVRC